MANKWDAIGRPDLDPLRGLDRHEPEAARLRREGQLWPENLSDAELFREITDHEREPEKHPISLPMLRAEAQRRQMEGRMQR